MNVGKHTASGRVGPARTLDPGSGAPEDFELQVIGDPGRAAAAVVPAPDGRFPDRNDIVVDGVRIAGATSPGLDLRAASVRGLSHRYYGTVRQDQYAFRVTKSGRWLVAAVADGVSAGVLSHVAADVVSREGCARLVELLERGDPADIDWRHVLRLLDGLVVDVAVRRFGAPDDVGARQLMATTALFAVVEVDPPPSSPRRVQVMTIGDTSAWLLSPGFETPWQPLAQVKNSGQPIASSGTAAIPGAWEPAAGAVEVDLYEDAVLVLMTDGIGDALGGGGGDVGEYFAGKWSNPPHPLEFAAQVDFARRTFDDDRTALVLWPVREP